MVNVTERNGQNVRNLHFTIIIALHKYLKRGRDHLRPTLSEPNWNRGYSPILLER